eukprot:12251830-Ditylum_brightwellii.AAC.1
MFHLAKDDDPSLTLHEVDKLLTEARKTLKLVQRNDAAFWDTHLEKMAKRQLKDRKGNLAAVIQNIKHRKEMKEAFKQMKPITKGISGEVVKELLIPNPDALSCPATYDEVLESLQFKHAQPLVVLDDQDE